MDSQSSNPQSNSIKKQDKQSTQTHTTSPIYSSQIINDFIYLGPLVFSLNRLKTLFTSEELDFFYDRTSKFTKDYKPQYILRQIPNRSLLALRQFQGNVFHPNSLSQEARLNFEHDTLKVSITKVICDIKFDHLTVLNLSKQKLYSIQDLAFMDTPKLRCLQLHNNHIHNIQPLVKSNFPNLQILTFYHNPVNKMDQFYRINNKKLTKYEFDSNVLSPNILEDYRFLFKMQNLNIKSLTVNDPNRINVKKSFINKLDKAGVDIIFYIPTLPPTFRRTMLRD